MTNVVFGNGVRHINSDLLDDCSSLTEIAIPSSVAAIDPGAFCDCFALQNITVVSGNSYYCSKGGVLYEDENSGKFSLFSCARARTGKFEIPVDVDTIGDYAFQDCDGLTGVTIPIGVTSINDDAFENCTRLTSVTIPAGVTSIGEEAFACCAALNTIVREGMVPMLGQSAFDLGFDRWRGFAQQANPGNAAASDLKQSDFSLTVYVLQASLDSYNAAFDSDVLGSTTAEIKAIPKFINQ